MPQTLLGVCTICPCPMGYPKPSCRGRYRSKSEGKCILEYCHVCHQVGPRKEWTKFCYKMKSCPTRCFGLVLHVHAQWVTPSPVPGGTISQSLEGGLLLNIRKLFTNQALERSEQNFVTEFNHVTHIAWCLYYMSMPNGLPQAWSQGAL